MAKLYGIAYNACQRHPYIDPNPCNSSIRCTTELVCLESGTQSQIVSTNAPLGCSFTYPNNIFDADISSFLNKDFCCVVTTFVSCNMQRSPLIGESNRFKELVAIIGTAI